MLRFVAHSGIPSFYRLDGQEILFDHGSRGHVFDSDGNGYVDFILGFGPVILGHAHPEFQARLSAYLENGIHLPGYTRWHEEYVQTLLRDIVTKRYAIFFKTSSEAVSAAMRICALATNRRGIVRCGYIGWHDALLANSVYWHEPPNSPLRGVIRHTSGYRGVGSDEPVFNWVDFDLERLRSLLTAEQSRVGAFVVDAYQLSFTDIYTMKQAVAICHEFGVNVVFDETKTAGRVSRLGLALDEGIDADLVVLGKALANGAPLSVLLGEQRLINLSREARISGTFSKELLGIFSGLATIQIMEELSGYNVIREQGQLLVDTFNNAACSVQADELVHAVAIFGGSMVDIRFSAEVMPKKFARERLTRHLAQCGILALEGHPSYTCIDHNLIVWELVSDSMAAALHAWKLWYEDKRASAMHDVI